MKRWIRFFIAIALGLAAGLSYGWLAHPGNSSNTPASALRIDFRADYVLMVAEAYHSDHDLEVAIQRLNNLSNAHPTDSIQEAILFGEKQGYSDIDLVAMQDLLQGIQGLNPAVRTPTP